MSLSIRPALPTDIPTIGTTAARAYYNTPWSLFTAPAHKRYPQDFILHYRRKARNRFLAPDGENHIFVAVSSLHPPEDTNSSLARAIPRPDTDIAGYIFFRRISRSVTSSARPLLSTRIKILFYRCHDFLHDLMWPNRAVSPAAIKKVAEESEAAWEERDQERWQVEALNVDPAWQRRGVGKMLLGLVLERAQGEGVSVGLGATGAGRGLYERVGFVMVREHAVVSVGGGRMVWRPREGEAGLC